MKTVLTGFNSKMMNYIQLVIGLVLALLIDGLKTLVANFPYVLGQIVTMTTYFMTQITLLVDYIGRDTIYEIIVATALCSLVCYSAYSSWQYVKYAEYLLTSVPAFRKVIDTNLIAHFQSDDEAAFANQNFVIDVEEVPKCIVDIYVGLDDEDKPTYAGKGWRFGERIVTANHVLSNSNGDIYISKPGFSRCIKVKICEDQPHTCYDIAYLDPGFTCVTLGITSAQVGLMVPNRSATVLTDVNGVWKRTACPLLWKSDFPFCVYTKSSTLPGDSGMPVFQNKKVVAVHKGAHHDMQTNLHIVVPFLCEQQWKDLANRNKEIDYFPKGVANSVESSIFGDKQAEEAAQAAREADDERIRMQMEADEEMKARMGENLDDQGFSMGRKSRRRLIHKFEGPDWADEDVEDEAIQVGSREEIEAARVKIFKDFQRKLNSFDQRVQSMLAPSHQQESSSIPKGVQDFQQAPKEGALQMLRHQLRFSLNTNESSETSDLTQVIDSVNTALAELNLSQAQNLESHGSSRSELSLKKERRKRRPKKTQESSSSLATSSPESMKKTADSEIKFGTFTSLLPEELLNVTE